MALAMTDRALRALAAERARRPLGPDECFRLLSQGSARAELVVGAPAPGDEIVHVDGVPVLYLSPDAVRAVTGRVLDYAGAPIREGFLLRGR